MLRPNSNYDYTKIQKWDNLNLEEETQKINPFSLQFLHTTHHKNVLQNIFLYIYIYILASLYFILSCKRLNHLDEIAS